MPKFTVVVEESYTHEFEIEADSRSEAREKASFATEEILSNFIEGLSDEATSNCNGVKVVSVVEV